MVTHALRVLICIGGVALLLPGQAACPRPVEQVRPAGSDPSQQPMAAEAMKAPWKVTYHDGAGNGFQFWQDAEGGEVRFDYSPVRPEQSSTGFYSGGEP